LRLVRAGRRLRGRLRGDRPGGRHYVPGPEHPADLRPDRDRRRPVAGAFRARAGVTGLCRDGPVPRLAGRARLGPLRVHLLPVLGMARLVTLIVFTVLAAAGWFLGARFVAPVPDDAHWIEELYAAKEGALHRIREPRVILVAGSSAHYSFSAAQLSRRMGSPV